jgi:hypothetical protein
MDRNIRKYFYDTSGNKILADIDENMLRDIAKRTGGRYFYAGDKRLFEEIFRDLDTTLSTDTEYQMREKNISIS